MRPFRVVAIDRLHLADVAVEFDVQLGELRIALSQHFEMLRLAARLAKGGEAGGLGGPQRGVGIGRAMDCSRMVVGTP